MIGEVTGIRKIRMLYLQLLYRCNFTCLHCFHGERLQYADAFSAEEAISLLTPVFGGLWDDQTYYAWIEVVPGENEVQISNLTVNPGDRMGVIVDYEPSTSQADFFVVDLTTNQGGEVTQAVNGTSGAQNEWIVERTCVGSPCQYSELANYGTEQISQAGGQISDNGTTTGYNLAQLAPVNTAMTDCNENNYLATVGPVDSTGSGFADTWKNYGTQEFC